jgi:hypothetical protein
MKAGGCCGWRIDPLHQALLGGMVSVQEVPLGSLPLQLVSHQTGTADDSKPRKLLFPRRNVTPLLHEALAWHGFQVEQQPISCQDVPSWLKRMHDRQLAMPLCPGLVDPGWIESKGLVPHPEQPKLIEQLWLLLPQGLVGSSREARHLIRTLRQRVEKAGESKGESPEHFQADHQNLRLSAAAAESGLLQGGEGFGDESMQKLHRDGSKQNGAVGAKAAGML